MKPLPGNLSKIDGINFKQLFLSEADTLKSSSILFYLVPEQSIYAQEKGLTLMILKNGG